MADGGGAAGAVKAEARGAVVFDGRCAIGVLECEHRLRLRQSREAVQLHHVGRFEMLQVVVHLAAAQSVSRSSLAQEQELRHQLPQRHYSIEGPSQGCQCWGVYEHLAFNYCCRPMHSKTSVVTCSLTILWGRRSCKCSQRGHQHVQGPAHGDLLC